MLKHKKFNNLYKLIFNLSLCIFILFIQSCNEEPQDESTEESQYLKDYLEPPSKWGLLNLNNEVVHEAEFDEIRPFKEGVAAVNLKGSWGYLDTSMDLTIKPVYRAAWNFDQNIARVQLMNGNYNFIDMQGNMLFEENFLYAHDFVDSYSTAQIGIDSFVIITREKDISPVIKAEDLYPVQYGYVISSSYGYDKLYTTDAEPVDKLEFDKITVASDSLFIVTIDGKYGVVNLQAETQIPFDYLRISAYDDWIVAFKKGAIDVYNGISLRKSFTQYFDLRYAGYNRFIFMENGKWGVMDTSFVEIAAAEYDQIDNFSQGLAPFHKNELWSYININGREVSKPKYGLALPYHENYARVVFYEGMALIDKYQKVKILPIQGTYRDVSASYIPFKVR